MKNILVTGADGFIGSHLTELLAASGYRVRALSYYNSFNSWGWLESISNLKDVEVVSGDIRDLHFCMNLLKDIDTVFHLAALIAIPYSYVAPRSYVDTNIIGTVNICQAALERDVKRVLITSTSEVYGTAQYVPIDEKHPLQPQSPYSASKIAADAMAMSFYHAYQLPVTIVRPFNTYGPRQSARAIIPTVITQIASGYKQIKVGNTIPTRDFNYVLDTARGMLAVARNLELCGEAVNIGSNSEISIADTLALIKNIMSSDVEIITDDQRVRASSTEVYRLWCDNSKAKKYIHYEPEFSLEQGLRETVQWFCDQKNLTFYKPELYNV